ncbi:MAG: phosphoribosylformimino-5-aminoimidazole carboxamide ribotide isomerase [Acidimicrobiales bacterium]|jgi:phosphoribosylformimino-5-aminoimidazole carboxamide ribotide isomerase
MRLYPAIDLRGGNCVRLYQGDYDQETVYAADPVAQAMAFVDAGTTWLHVVDLDAALTGEPTNRPVIAAICEASPVPVQVGGGVRTIEAAEALFDAGVTRVVIGTAALENPELVRALAAVHPVAVGLDARGGEVATHGWTEKTGRTVGDLASEFADAGVAALVVTEISRDGTLAGPDVDGLSQLLASTDIPVIASGGVGSLGHLRTLAGVTAGPRQFEGVIVGKAIYEGAFTVAEAVAVLDEAGAR